MANSWQNPRLTTPIRTDVPELQEKLIALLKQDPTPISDIPSGAKRLYEASSGKWQWQLYNGTSWAPVPFLQHNVDQLDGYHAAITPTANTVAVRNASGLLEDSIAGNAATATTATTLSQTLPVNKGGTGATTSEAARSNLGVPPTSHASANTTYGIGNAKQYGHLKLSDATDSLSGATGGIAATPAAVKAAKDAADAAQSSADAAQSSADAAQSSADAAMTKASTLATASTPGIVKPGTGMTVDAAGALNVEASSASTPGIVKSSETAQAGAVPVGGADGSLGEGWLKKAMEAARNAQTTADEAKSAAESGGKVVSKGTRSTAGDWTISNLTVGKPLYILMDSTTTASYLASVDIRTISGAIGGVGNQGNYMLGRREGGYGPLTMSPPTFIVVPTSTRVVINLDTIINCKLTAFQ